MTEAALTGEFERELQALLDGLAAHEHQLTPPRPPRLAASASTPSAPVQGSPPSPGAARRRIRGTGSSSSSSATHSGPDRPGPVRAYEPVPWTADRRFHSALIAAATRVSWSGRQIRNNEYALSRRSRHPRDSQRRLFGARVWFVRWAAAPRRVGRGDLA